MRVLLATDGSENAAIAEALVGNIQWPLGTSIQVVRVVPSGDRDSAVAVGPWPLGLATSTHADTAEVQEAEEHVRGVVGHLGTGSLNVNHAVLRGRPSDALLEWIGRHRPDLVVVGTRGKSEIAQALIGSVSAQLIDRSPVPVLIARRATLERVVVAVDGSDIATEAVASVKRWPFLSTTTIRTLSVAPEPVMWWPVEHLRGTPEPEADERDAAADVLMEHDATAAEAASALAAAGFAVQPEVRKGPAAAAIVTFLREWDADLVIMGSHGRTGVSRLLLGSVARNVLHHAECSVLVIRRHAEPARGRRADLVAFGPRIPAVH